MPLRSRLMLSVSTAVVPSEMMPTGSRMRNIDPRCQGLPFWRLEMGYLCPIYVVAVLERGFGYLLSELEARSFLRSAEIIVISLAGVYVELSMSIVFPFLVGLACRIAEVFGTEKLKLGHH